MHDRDCLHRFMFERYPIRGHLVHLDTAWHALIEHREYPAPIRDTLGEAVAAINSGPTFHPDGWRPNGNECLTPVLICGILFHIVNDTM